MQLYYVICDSELKLNAYWDPDGFYVSSYYAWEEVKA